jgi:hypothetical protein
MMTKPYLSVTTRSGAAAWRMLEISGGTYSVALPSLDEERIPGAVAERLYCRACQAPVTAVSLAMEKHGSHMHQFINPIDMKFRIGCFSLAPGCLTAGDLTGQYTWFAGYQWCYALCAGCGGHLGWHYRGVDEFYGLILSRLVDGCG